MSDKDGKGQSRYAQRKEQNDDRKKIRRFTFQLSLHDGEVREWFERQPDKGAYLKRLILADKEQTAEPNRTGTARTSTASLLSSLTQSC